MDTFRTIARGLILAFALWLLAMPCVFATTASDTIYPNAGLASSACVSDNASSFTSGGVTYTMMSGCGAVVVSGTYTGYFTPKYQGGSQTNACNPSATVHCGAQYRYDTRNQGTYCQTAPNVVGTIYSADNAGPPSGNKNGCLYYPCNVDSNSNGTGESAFTGTWCATGAVAPSGQSDTPGFGPDVNGQQPTQPKLCGGGSCYDPTTNQFCSVVGGSQVCVKGPPGASGAPANTPYPGACASSASGTICAGQPAPPPPAPPASPISDPPTQIKSTDQYQTGAVSGSSPSSVTTTNGNTTVNTYAAPGATSGSGKSSSDNGPAPASTSPSADHGSVSGGADCNSPPVCSGDNVMCGVVRQQWYAMCASKKATDQLHKDLAGDGTSPDGDHVDSSGLWDGGSGTGNSVGDAANQGSYDQSGLGFSTDCPLHDMTVPLPLGASFDIKFSAGCELGGWLKAIIIAFALFAAARITAGGAG